MAKSKAEKFENQSSFTMDKYEFLDFLEQSQKKLSKELYDFVFDYYPIYLRKQDELSEKLKEYANQYAKKALDDLGMIDYYVSKNITYKSKYPVRKPQTRQESLKDLQELVDLCPDEDKEYAEKIHWESFYETQEAELFDKGIHDKVKEILVEFYGDEILELRSDLLRMIDSYTHTTVYQYIEDVYVLLES